MYTCEFDTPGRYSKTYNADDIKLARDNFLKLQAAAPLTGSSSSDDGLSADATSDGEYKALVRAGGKKKQKVGAKVALPVLLVPGTQGEPTLPQTNTELDIDKQVNMEDSEGKKYASEDRESLEALEDSDYKEASLTEILIRHGNSSTNVHGTETLKSASEDRKSLEALEDSESKEASLTETLIRNDNSTTYVLETEDGGAKANATEIKAAVGANADESESGEATTTESTQSHDGVARANVTGTGIATPENNTTHVLATEDG